MGYDTRILREVREKKRGEKKKDRKKPPSLVLHGQVARQLIMPLYVAAACATQRNTTYVHKIPGCGGTVAVPRLRQARSVGGKGGENAEVGERASSAKAEKKAHPSKFPTTCIGHKFLPT